MGRLGKLDRAVNRSLSYRDQVIDGSLFFRRRSSSESRTGDSLTCNLLKFKAEFRSQNWPEL